jgi:hypothetical protein
MNLGFSGEVVVRDLWQRQNIGAFGAAFVPKAMILKCILKFNPLRSYETEKISGRRLVGLGFYRHWPNSSDSGGYYPSRPSHSEHPLGCLFRGY